MDENSKKLRKMATWTAAIFATVFAIVMAVLWIPFYNAGTPAFTAIGRALAAGWVVILIALVLCVGSYLGYSFYIKRKK